MLRSLVGSEMCIRDRDWVAAQKNDAQPDKPDDRDQAKNSTHHLGQPGDCLLYTSDAADDLPCVDLGGRRIIKKKKNKRRLYRYRRTQ